MSLHAQNGEPMPQRSEQQHSLYLSKRVSPGHAKPTGIVVLIQSLQNQLPLTTCWHLSSQHPENRQRPVQRTNQRHLLCGYVPSYNRLFQLRTQFPYRIVFKQVVEISVAGRMDYPNKSARSYMQRNPESLVSNKRLRWPMQHCLLNRLQRLADELQRLADAKFCSMK